METTPTASEPLEVSTVLSYMLEQIAGLAWQKMGLQPDVMTGKIHKDLAQAKQAIDASVALINILDPELDDEDKRRLKNLASDLRINYIQQSSGGQS